MTLHYAKDGPQVSVKAEQVLMTVGRKPFDEAAVLQAAQTGFIVTMEEHSVNGGLGSTVSQAVCAANPVPVRVLAIPDEPAVAGNTAEVFGYYGLTAQNAAEIIRNQVRGV